MLNEKVYNWLKEKGFEDRITEHKEIEVTYQDEDFVERTQKFSGFIAQVVQHEVDHLEGIII